MTKVTHTSQTVYEAALDRVRYVYDECDDVIVSMSGGKDSTVLLHLARTVAAERGKLPLKVYWLDQEAEWQATEDFMRGVMTAPDVRPYWFQIPFRLTNSLSFDKSYLHCWNPAERDKWLRPQDPMSIKTNPMPGQDRFYYLVKNLPAFCDMRGKRHVGVLVGLRMAESLNRRYQLWCGKAQYKGIKWCHTGLTRNTRSFWPIYDWQNRDVWICIARNRLPYNRAYDQFYRYGIADKDMRVSALIHETSWTWIKILQEVEPGMYERYIQRLAGVSTFNHLGDNEDILPRSLPPFFADWRDYRDYLLANLVEPRNRGIFVHRWRGQEGTEWHKAHVREVMLNDVDGTINISMYNQFRMAAHHAEGRY